MAEHMTEDMHGVLVAVRGGKLEDGEIHFRFAIFDLREGTKERNTL